MSYCIEHKRECPPMVIPPGLETWTDHRGKVWSTPTVRQRLKSAKIPAHAALRAYIFVRDGFACQECGIVAAQPPDTYGGRTAVSLGKKDCCLVIDHIVSRRNGGIHHPSNLRTACSRCNSAKASVVDAKHPNAVRERELIDRKRYA
jgi:5-methylcytosine-specific restriction endonuclease McrA